MIIYKVRQLSAHNLPPFPRPTAAYLHTSPIPPTIQPSPLQSSKRRASPTNCLPQDIITGDEIISDSYNLKEIDGAVYEADCKKITIGNDNIDIGANPSAEEADEALEEGAQQVIDVVHSFRLNETSFDKKSYLSHLKSTPPSASSSLVSSGLVPHLPHPELRRDGHLV